MGYTCHYFGQNVPIYEVNIAISQIKPLLVVTTFTTKMSDKNLKKVKDELVSFSKNSQILVSGSQNFLNDLGKLQGFHHLRSISQLKAML